MNKFLKSALTFLFVGAASFLPGTLNSATAASVATTHGVTATLTSAKFIAYATTSTSGANPSAALVLSNSSSAQYFYIRNTGDLAITAVSIALSYSTGAGTVTFNRCAVGIAFSGSSCASGPTKTTVTASPSVTLAIPAGSWYAFEINPKNPTTPTINVSVSSSQIRLPITTNS